MALDVVGDRWTLLIVRELLIRGACRYTDLRSGLPGIATNLLAERLRELEQEGLIVREEAPPPIATTLVRLTARGQALERVILELGRWGAPLLAEGTPGHQLLLHWLVLPLRLHLVDSRPDQGACTIAIRAGAEGIAGGDGIAGAAGILITANRGVVTVDSGRPEQADLVLTGDAATILTLLVGRISVAAARVAGVDFKGRTDLLSRVVPRSDRSSRQ
jgi:DNA-binding HxlR family transcriptional regulator